MTYTHCQNTVCFKSPVLKRQKQTSRQTKTNKNRKMRNHTLLYGNSIDRGRAS